MTSPRSLAVSIVNTKQWDWLEPCLRSVLERPYTLGRFEVVVLDNFVRGRRENLTWATGNGPVVTVDGGLDAQQMPTRPIIASERA
jgi:hypothetical protein